MATDRVTRTSLISSRLEDLEDFEDGRGFGTSPGGLALASGRPQRRPGGASAALGWPSPEARLQKPPLPPARWMQPPSPLARWMQLPAPLARWVQMPPSPPARWMRTPLPPARWAQTPFGVARLASALALAFFLVRMPTLANTQQRDT